MNIYDLQSPMVYAAFNGLLGSLLCLSHAATCKTQHGNEVELSEGMIVTAYDEDADEHGNSDWLIATGRVIGSPEWLRCGGSIWALEIDANGLRNQSEISQEWAGGESRKRPNA
jgi:hypothetical protein